MKAHCITFTGDRATVVLEPSWLGKMCGYRTLSLDLERKPRSTTSSHCGWVASATGRAVEELWDSSAIINALDFREIGTPARWSLPSSTEPVAP